MGEPAISENVIELTAACTKCNCVRPLSFFPKDKRSPGGHISYCRECRTRMSAEWYRLNPGKKKQYRKASLEKASKNVVAPPPARACTKCGIHRPISEFNRSIYERDGRSRQCKECTRKRYHKHRQANRLEVNERAALRGFKKRYGLSPEALYALIDAQGSRCGICRDPIMRGMGKMAVDHDHSTGKIRGILCGRCNTGLGLFRENKKIFLAAMEYLDRAKGET